MQKSLLLIFNIFLSASFSTSMQSSEIRIGQIINDSGEFKKYADAITFGIKAGLHQINATGGVKGKRLLLITKNDGGDPTKARAIVQDLMEQDNIDLFLGSMGSRSVQELIPDLQKGSISLLFPWSGDDAQRSSAPRHLINGPGLLQPQTEAIAKYVCDELRLKKIALFHADDPFSTTATQQLQTALKKRAVSSVVTASYNRRILNIKKATNKLIDVEPKLVACVGT
ncbi:hypothetical protein FJ364_03940, partial [Candidatus Dependentiae bacterium]|nr:hypothetical protein [Candidatus Dependentiae bacterium]